MVCGFLRLGENISYHFLVTIPGFFLIVRRLYTKELSNHHIKFELNLDIIYIEDRR